ncbi:MAG: hypothetical protein M0Q91_17160 [Methanoregula sp.]|jgi:hypothetical protein|nr:hypothetical protein [Methanoregula sp.]
MSEKQRLAELTIKVPERWAKFLDEYYATTGYERDIDLCANVGRLLALFIADLPAKEQLRVVKKYRLNDVYDIPKCGAVSKEALSGVFCDMVRGGLVDTWLLNIMRARVLTCENSS